MIWFNIPRVVGEMPEGLTGLGGGSRDIFLVGEVGGEESEGMSFWLSCFEGPITGDLVKKLDID
jgi:hypothetical protein